MIKPLVRAQRQWSVPARAHPSVTGRAPAFGDVASSNLRAGWRFAAAPGAGREARLCAQAGPRGARAAGSGEEEPFPPSAAASCQDPPGTRVPSRRSRGHSLLGLRWVCLLQSFTHFLLSSPDRSVPLLLRGEQEHGGAGGPLLIVKYYLPFGPMMTISKGILSNAAPPQRQNKILRC